MRTVSVRHDLLTPHVIPSFAFSILIPRMNLDFVAKRADSIQCIEISHAMHNIINLFEYVGSVMDIELYNMNVLKFNFICCDVESTSFAKFNRLT